MADWVTERHVWSFKTLKAETVLKVIRWREWSLAKQPIAHEKLIIFVGILHVWFYTLHSMHIHTHRHPNTKIPRSCVLNLPALRAWISGRLLRKLVPGPGWYVKRTSSWEHSWCPGNLWADGNWNDGCQQGSGVGSTLFRMLHIERRRLSVMWAADIWATAPATIDALLPVITPLPGDESCRANAFPSSLEHGTVWSTR